MNWIDSHCHLEMLKGKTADIMAQSRQEGMEQCIAIGINHASNHKILEYCQDHAGVWGTLGYHPHQASEFQEQYLPWVKQQMTQNHRLVGLGECGYDLYYEHSSEEEQKKAFALQLEAACELDLPVVIHTREAEGQTKDMLQAFRHKGLKGVVHSFTSSVDLARFVLDLGFYISFNGICTFPKSEGVREVLKLTPKDRILLETDAPFLTPVPHRGRPNIPGYVRLVGEFVAEFLQIDPAELAEQTGRNCKALFQRMDHEG